MNTEDLDKACALLRDKAGASIQDKETRDSVLLLIEAHENAKQVISMLQGQLERTYEILDRITANPEFKRLMESMRNDGKA